MFAVVHYSIVDGPYTVYKSAIFRFLWEMEGTYLCRVHLFNSISDGVISIASYVKIYGECQSWNFYVYENICLAIWKHMPRCASKVHRVNYRSSYDGKVHTTFLSSAQRYRLTRLVHYICKLFHLHDHLNTVCKGNQDTRERRTLSLIPRGDNLSSCTWTNEWTNDTVFQCKWSSSLY